MIDFSWDYSMFLLGFIHSIIFGVLGLFQAVSQVIIGQRALVVGDLPAQSPIKKQSKKRKNRKNKRPSTLKLKSISRPNTPEEVEEKMSFSTAHLNGRTLKPVNNTTIAEYRISKDFFIEITEQHVLFSKQWNEHTQESKWSISEFCQLVSCANGIIQFAEVR